MSATQQKYHLEKSNLPGLSGETSILKNSQNETFFFVKEVTVETLKIFFLAQFILRV